MSHHTPSPRRRTPVIAALPASLPVTRKSRASVAARALDASGVPGKPPSRKPRGLYLALALTVAIALGVVFGAVLGAPASSAQDAPDLWVTAAMLIPRNSHSLTELLDGRLLAAGGWDGIAPLASVELFDPARRAWTPTGALSETRAYHTAARLPDGRVLVAGGWDLLGRPLTSTEIYDPAAGAWQPGAALAEGRAGHVAVTLADGRILVAAGCGRGDQAISTAEVYDPVTAVWQPTGALAEGRCWPTATVLADGRVLLVGGRGRDGQALASAELFDPANNAWTPAGRLLTPRLEHTATLLSDGRVLVTGGYDGNAYLASAEVYDPATNAWRAAGDLNAARANHAAVLLRDGRILVAGGAAGDRPTLETETYDPAVDHWTPAGPLPARYEAFLLTVLRDGGLLVTGRPDSGDLTGNDGYPTPTPRIVTPRPTRTPRPWDRLLTPQPTSAPNRGNGAISADTATLGSTGISSTASAAASMTSITTMTVTNYSVDNATAALYGVHEVSFTRTLPSATDYNPYAITLTVTFDPPELDASENITVRAFYDGASGNVETWRARAYVNRVGDWSWTSSVGVTGTFAATPALESGLHGMLRVSSSAGGETPKRWYTDDGRTFLPMADTAYYLFFEKPITVTIEHPMPTVCPNRTADNAPQYIRDYVDAVIPHGINTLRAMAFGSFAHPQMQTPAGTSCVADLSLYWSTSTEAARIDENLQVQYAQDFYDGAPTISALATSGQAYYPNLGSFQATDRKLQLLLDEYPELYIQMILAPDGATDVADVSGLMNTDSSYRKQLWQTMMARWAAFPNVFWTVENDLDDGPATKALDLGNEISCYFSDHPASGSSSGVCQGITVVDPWRQNRPFGFGHERGAEDGMRAQSWLNYISAYAEADIAAQQMDGQREFVSEAGINWDLRNFGSVPHFP